MLCCDEGVGVQVIQQMEFMELPGHIELLDMGTSTMDLISHLERVKKLILVSSIGLGREIALWLRILSIPTIVKILGTLVGKSIEFIGWMLERANPFELVLPISPVFVRIGTSIANFHQQSMIFEKYLPKIKIPTMLIWGARDPVVPVKTAYRAVKEFPNARLLVFKKSGHNVHREQLKNVTRLINEFLG